MQRGFTIVEMALAVGILALLAAAGGAFALGMRPFAMRTAAAQFGAQLQSARSLAAATGNGATVVVTLRDDGSGFHSVVYGGRPNGTGTLTALTPTSFASVDSNTVIAIQGLGGAPFSIFLSSSGNASIASDYPRNASSAPSFESLANEPQTCPQPENAYTLTFALNGTAETLSLPCRVAVSGTPLPIVTNSPAP